MKTLRPDWRGTDQKWAERSWQNHQIGPVNNKESQICSPIKYSHYLPHYKCIGIFTGVANFKSKTTILRQAK